MFVFGSNENLKFAFEIYWPLPAASFASMHFNWWLEQHHSAWIWLRFKMEMALSLSKNQIHSILSYWAHAIPLLNMENKGLKKKRGAKLPLPQYYTLFSIFCQQIEMTSKEFEWMIWEKNIFPETPPKVQLFWKGHKNLKKSLLLSKNNCYVKTGGRFFQMLWPSHNIWTLQKNTHQNCQQKTICLWICHLGHAPIAPVPKK